MKDKKQKNVPSIFWFFQSNIQLLKGGEITYIKL